ncbi:hypothetical protein [Aeromicrobium sp. UC242_57]|uniref:hypothetical protein n=1 Tax=Aeromicrobium sp. UC242_57 TaxID=3374624 RepID=UPI0037A20E4D
MRLRFAGRCRVCGTELPAQVEAIYERASKTVRCLTHVEPYAVAVVAEPIDIGTPGASARREFERRKAGRQRRVRAKHPKIGGLLHALTDEPQSTKSWDVGTSGRSVKNGSAAASMSWPPTASVCCTTVAFQDPEPTSITSL